MTDKNSDFIDRLRSRMLPLLKGNNTAKVFFLILSVFLWFLINLGKDGYSASVSYPVKYDSIPSGYRLINEPPRHLQVELRGKGFAILRIKLKSLDPINMSLADVRISDSNNLEWSTRDKMAMVEREVGDKVEVMNILPEKIVFQFSPINSRKFKIHLNWKREFSKFKTFYQPPKLTPDSLIIWGTENELAQVDSIKTRLVRLKAEEDSASFELPLLLPDIRGLEYSHESVWVNLRYTSLTEGKLEIPIKVRNKPPGYKVTLIPKRVSVTYRVALEDFSKIEGDDFEVYVDYRDIERSSTEFLKLQLEETPGLVRNFSLKPDRVEFVLTR